jgi:CheY-like chemotaxis protein
MDGYEATRQIREHETEQNIDKTPIIAMTGNAFEKDREKCFQAGMDDFLSKPVEPEVLNRMLYTHLSKEENNKTVEAAEPEVLPESIESLEQTPGVNPGQYQGVNPGQYPVFDREKCNERFGNDEELVQVVLDSFFQEITELINNLKTAVQDWDNEQIRSCAHALKGSAANVNAEQLRETAFTLEKMAKQENIEPLDQLLSTIETQLNAFTGEARL